MSKDKWVRRFSVDETSRHKDGFTIYKITSVLFPIQSPEVMTEVSVWKRYSDVQRLHSSMKAIHAGLHLQGTFPVLPKYSYFKRFQQEVIEERAKVIKTLLEFIAEHKLLFTSTDFVNFLQSGYPSPSPALGTIATIRTSLKLPAEPAPPLEYSSDDDDDVTSVSVTANPTHSTDETDCTAIQSIPIHKGFEIERRVSPLPERKEFNEFSNADSFESIDSLDSGDLYSEIEKTIIPKPPSQVKKNVLPDLIIFDAPSTSIFDDYHTTRLDSETTSITSHSKSEYTRSSSRVSNRSMLSLSNASIVECKTKTEDSYVFEAGYLLNLAARYEDMKEYARAFECYKAGIEKMLIGVQTDPDPQRRCLIKEKTNKYLSYAETFYNKHLCDVERGVLSELSPPARLHCPIPLLMLRRPYEELSLYRVIAVLGGSIMLVLHRGEQTCYAMKVIQKIPNNLTEFDEYFLQNTIETRQPILPTVIPYMVPLHSYIESNNLIFLILSYAPGEKLFDYIKNYAKSVPNTPAREVNLENVFTEPCIDKTDSKDVFNKPNIKKSDKENGFSEPKVKKSDNVEALSETDIKNSDIENENLQSDSKISITDRIENNGNNNVQKDDISELVLNSQKLLKNVEKALSGEVKCDEESVGIDQVDSSVKKIEEYTDNVKSVRRRVESPSFDRCGIPRGVLPAGALCRWGAQLLTAIHSLHNCGVVCRDLKPSNILLGDAGQIILTYFYHYPGLEMALSKLQTKPGEHNLYVAPELYRHTFVDDIDESLEKVCDFWSFGAIMYELICGVPLSYYHRSIFTTHTILQLPDDLPIEVQSLLTQLLTYEPSERLGAGKDGIEEIKRHPYFKSIDWQEIYDKWSMPD